jgi:hypothetical protein
LLTSSDPCATIREPEQLANILEPDYRYVIDFDQTLPFHLGKGPAHRLNRQAEKIGNMDPRHGQVDYPCIAASRLVPAR